MTNVRTLAQDLATAIGPDGAFAVFQLRNAGYTLRLDGTELLIQKRVGLQARQYRVASPQEFQQVFWTVMFTP